MPLGLPVEPEVYSRYSGCSASTHSGSHVGRLALRSTSCHQTSRPACMATGLPVRLSTITRSTLGQPLAQGLVGGGLQLDRAARRASRRRR